MESRIKEDLKKNQLLANELEVATLRLLISEMRYAQIAKGQELTDEDIITIIQKEIKKRKESSLAFRQGNREELAEREEAELSFLQTYLPEQLSEEELTVIVKAAINELGASSLQDMGKVIGAVKGKVGQSADGGTISQIVKQQLLG